MSGPPAGGPRDDRTLLQAHLDGDPTAFGELVARHRDRLWAVALRTARHREDAADALQDALLSAFRNAGSYRGDAAVTTWLHRIVINACLDRLRRDRARPRVPLGDVDVPARHDEHSGAEARLMVHAALARLPSGQREAIILVDLLELSVAEAARTLRVAEGTVKSRCSRGRAELARLLGDRLPQGPPSRRESSTAQPDQDPNPNPGAGPSTGPGAGAGNRRSRSRVARGDVRAPGAPGPAASGGGP